MHPVLLSSYAAKQCPVRIQNDYSPAVPTLMWVPLPEDQLRLDAGRSFEAAVFARLAALHPDCVHVDTNMSSEAAIAATLSAMDRNSGLILGGWLPHDPKGGRTGRPDILIRGGDGYFPVDIKSHKALKTAKKTSAILSTLADPATRVSQAELTSATPHRFEDGMQLAHYTRMLQACGRHPGDNQMIGAIIGTDLVPDVGSTPEWVLTWYDLREPVFWTYSRSHGRMKRSLLERYDHEHGFRVKVAHRALEIRGKTDDPPPLVAPIGQAECTSCPYEVRCATAMADDPSAQIRVGSLDTREWRALRSMGITTTLELAELDPNEDAFFKVYAPEVAHHLPQRARERLALAVKRASMIRDGIKIWPHSSQPVDIPTATVEIDVDIEFDSDNRVYMWGARVRRGCDDATAVYVPNFVVWDSLDVEAEHALATRFVQWLRDQRAAVESVGGTIRGFQWSHPEWSNLKRIVGEDSLTDLIGGDEEGVFFDLEAFLRTNFTFLHGTSLKKVAPLFGFRWRVEDPSGASSQVYLAKARTFDGHLQNDAAKAWLLSYNEDDNRAMAVIRDGMRAWSRFSPN